MNYVVNSLQMKAIDTYTIDKINIPSMVLMERAALQVAEQVKKYASKNTKILAVCGVGNNGGDGVAVARILNSDGYLVEILVVGNEKKASKETIHQIGIARNLGISINNNIRINEYTIIIDALFGIGLNKTIDGEYERIIEEINAGEHVVFAVDIPSGLSANTAKPMNIAVKANYTITFGLNKLGLLLHPGCEYAGEVIIADIGFPHVAIEAINPNYFSYDKTDINRLPLRQNYSNKGTYGKVLVIAGSINMSGACYFSAKAAYRSGAGLVKVLTVEENRTIINTMLPEAILSTYNQNLLLDTNAIETIKAEINWASVIVIGPGMGANHNTEKLLELVIQNTKSPIIIDADGINLLANMLNKTKVLDDYDQIKEENVIVHDSFNIENRNRLKKLAEYLPENTILTPHLKELSRLIDMPITYISDNLIDIADECTYNNKLIFTIKDARTIVAYDNQRYINTTGNDGMATGGTGDVLTGIIAAFIAQGLTPKESAVLGVYIHGLAGDIAAKNKGKYALIASDIIEALANVCNLIQ